MSMSRLIQSDLLRPLVYAPLRHLYRLITRPKYRSDTILASRLEDVPRFQPCKLKVAGLDLEIPDAASFLSAYREIFTEEIYDFTFDGESPAILDLGANIGLSVLYFKRRFPKARITAFEADPGIFSYLQKNLAANGFGDVELHNKAAWNKNERLRFDAEGADGGSVTSEGTGNTIEVEAIDLDDFLRGRHYDFIKMDIEGAEEQVLPVCKDHLSGVRYIFVEYHSRRNRPQCLAGIIGILSSAGYRLSVETLHATPVPFVKKESDDAGFDLQLNIFGWRE